MTEVLIRRGDWRGEEDIRTDTEREDYVRAQRGGLTLYK